MNAKEELLKWKADFAKCDSEKAKLAHKQRFEAYLKTLPVTERKEFIAEFKKSAMEAVEESGRLKAIIERKQKLEKIMDFASMSYIAEHYFGKTRQWLYQRINGNIVNGKPADFTPDELQTLSRALSELGDTLKKTSLSLS